MIGLVEFDAKWDLKLADKYSNHRRESGERDVNWSREVDSAKGQARSRLTAM